VKWGDTGKKVEYQILRTLFKTRMVKLPSAELDKMCQNERGTIDELDSQQQADWSQQTVQCSKVSCDWVHRSAGMTSR